MKIYVEFQYQDCRRKVQALITILLYGGKDDDLPNLIFSDNKFVGEEGRDLRAYSPMFSTQAEVEAWVENILRKIGAYWREVRDQRTSLPKKYDLTEEDVMNL